VGEGKRGYVYEVEDRSKSLWDAKAIPDCPFQVERVSFVWGQVALSERVSEMFVEGARFFTSSVVMRGRCYRQSVRSVISASSQLFKKQDPLEGEMLVWELDGDGVAPGSVVVAERGGFRGWYEVAGLEDGELQLRMAVAKRGKNFDWREEHER